MGCCSSGEKERVEQPSARGETNSVKSYASAGGRSGVSEERKSGSDLRSLPPRESRILTYRVSADSDEGSPSEIWPIMPPDIAYNPYMSPSMRNSGPTPERCHICNMEFIEPVPASIRVEHMANCQAIQRTQLLFHRLSAFQALLFDHFRAEDIPYVGWIKSKDKYNTLNWIKVAKPALTDKQFTEIVEKTSIEAKTLLTEDKRMWFYNRIAEIKNMMRKEPIMLIIDRHNFFRDSFEQFRTRTDLDLRNDLRIHFIDEVAQDAGGLIREWFSIITDELFKKEHGLFLYIQTGKGEGNYMINPYAQEINSEFDQLFYFAGQVFAKALYNRIPIKGLLNPIIYKTLITEELSFDHLQLIDKELWKSLSYIKDHEIEEEVLMMNFTVCERNPFTNKQCVKELKPDGQNISLTENNKAEFIQLMLKHYFHERISEQYSAFSSGFYSLIPIEMVSIFDSEELEFFLCGETTIDIEDWLNNTQYKGVYNPQHQIIIWYWKIVHEMDQQQLRKFLQFCTGTSRVPIEGFSALQSNNGKVCKFCIEPKMYEGENKAFISAHTCFNRIELPLFEDYATMRTNIVDILESPHIFHFDYE